jgi:tetratricopeptide (TPR) repeat protein
MKKKISDSWYKNKTWNGDIDSHFERQLRYTRNELHKASYLQVQGCLLLDNAAANIQEVGQVLLERLFEDFPRAFDQRLQAQEKLGDYFYGKQEYEKAAEYFKQVTEYTAEQQSRTHTSGKADLKWAASLYKMGNPAGFEKAAELVAAYPEKLLQTPAQQFYHAELGAWIANAMQNIPLAISYALAALKVHTLLKPNPPAARVAELVKIAEG